MILRGKVVSGMGEAGRFIEMMKDSFYKKTKMKLYAGTLNIKLDKEYNLTPDYIVKPEEYGGSFNVQIQKCKLLQEDAYLLRSEKNIGEDGDYGQNIVEVISDIKFRDKYKLKDGDKIEILIK